MGWITTLNVCGTGVLLSSFLLEEEMWVNRWISFADLCMLGVSIEPPLWMFGILGLVSFQLCMLKNMDKCRWIIEFVQICGWNSTLNVWETGPCSVFACVYVVETRWKNAGVLLNKLCRFVGWLFVYSNETATFNVWEVGSAFFIVACVDGVGKRRNVGKPSNLNSFSVGICIFNWTKTSNVWEILSAFFLLQKYGWIFDYADCGLVVRISNQITISNV